MQNIFDLLGHLPIPCGPLNIDDFRDLSLNTYRRNSLSRVDHRSLLVIHGGIGVVIVVCPAKLAQAKSPAPICGATGTVKRARSILM
jgi:hypothetical protein